MKIFISRLIALIMLQLSLVPCVAVMVTGDFDNSILPAENRGQYYIGTFNAYTGVVVSTNQFLTANREYHIGGNVGNIFTIGGVSYTTIATENDPSIPGITGTTRWTISGTFPTDRIAPIWTNAEFMNVEMFVLGRGYEKGAKIYRPSLPIKIENFCVSNGVVSFNGVGGTVGASCTVQFTTNASGGTWTDIPGTYMVPVEGWFPVSFPQPACAQVFYRIKVEPIGFSFGSWTGAVTYGMNHIGGAIYYEDGTYLLWFTMDHNGEPEECGIAPGDSSGLAFSKDTDGVWKLIGIIYGAYTGPFSFTEAGPLFRGVMFDVQGLYPQGSQYPFTAGYSILAPQFLLSPIPVAWLRGQ